MVNVKELMGELCNRQILIGGCERKCDQCGLDFKSELVVEKLTVDVIESTTHDTVDELLLKGVAKGSMRLRTLIEHSIEEFPVLTELNIDEVKHIISVSDKAIQEAVGKILLREYGE